MQVTATDTQAVIDEAFVNIVAHLGDVLTAADLILVLADVEV